MNGYEYYTHIRATNNIQLLIAYGPAMTHTVLISESQEKE